MLLWLAIHGDQTYVDVDKNRIFVNHNIINMRLLLGFPQVTNY